MSWKTGLLFSAALVLTACQTETDEPVEPGIFDPGLVDRQRTQCETDGGRWGAGARSGQLVCYMTPDDANQSCSSSADCESLCLARSRTCAPVTPFFGCHEVLNSRGAKQTLCID